MALGYDEIVVSKLKSLGTGEEKYVHLQREGHILISLKLHVVACDFTPAWCDKCGGS